MSMGVAWTADQKKVIELRNRNILVSAAAGSGKTAVLVERIMEKVCDETKPVDIDRLLVVTFTKAAAAEMKERVGNAIRKKLEEQPNNGYLQKQEALVSHAQITTIDSFCTYILRNHFGEIDLDPAFRVADEGELKLLKQDVVKGVLEEAYGEGSPEFLNFVECFASGKNDKVLEELILKLYEFSTSDPFPEVWLENLIEEKNEDWKLVFLEHLRLTIEDLLSRNGQLIKWCTEPDGPCTYEEALQADRDLLLACKNCVSYEDYAKVLGSCKFAALSRKKMPPEVLPEKKELVKSQRDSIKKAVANLQKQYFYASPDMIEQAEKTAGPAKRALLRLTLTFAQQFSAAKRKRNIVDFSDIEHLALKILVQKEGESYVPTLAAKGYGDFFDEIMIDEYQDSNLVQELLLGSISKKYQNGHNQFMVGDVKQSIYRFRQARPELFMEKQETYTLEESTSQRINLSKNFRSRPQVLDSVNDLFGQIMRKELGNVAYDAEAALYPGAAMPEGEPGEFQTELMLLSLSSEEESEASVNKIELEAAMVAQKINRLIQTGRVTEKKTGELRPARYGDMVILLRTMSGWSETFANVLASYGIPSVSGSTTGYFSATEVQTILNFLKVLDNPRQDIPLCAVLNSPIGNLDAKELAEIRSAFPEAAYHEACSRYVTEGADPSLKEKLTAFYTMTGKLRKKAEYLPIHELLWEIYEQTFYDRIVELWPNGSVRKANLQMLVQKALDFEATSYRGLFHFVRYIDSLQKYDVDYGMAETSMGDENAVHLMSIHKSKGLEFPIVFVSGMAKQFNKQDSRKNIAMHPQLGVGIDAVNPKLRTRMATLQKKAIQKHVELESLGEELRVLYVALTRAKDKLILTAVKKDAEDTVENLFASEGAELSYEELCKASCYLDWILPAWCRSEAPVSVKIVTLYDVMEQEVKKQIQETDSLTSLLTCREDVSKELTERFTYRYPYLSESALPGKVSVSELKKAEWTAEDGEALFEEEQIIPYVPGFLKETREISAADRGTAYHKVMECMDLSGIRHSKQVEERMAQLTAQGKLSEAVVGVIRPYEIYQFCQTELCRRMIKAKEQGKLYQEQQFVIAKAAGEIYPKSSEAQELLIQGVMDAYFEEADGYVLVDYKTDRIRTKEELLALYEKQLFLYAEALEQLSGKRVKECWLYSFTLGEGILAERR